MYFKSNIRDVHCVKASICHSRTETPERKLVSFNQDLMSVEVWLTWADEVQFRTDRIVHDFLLRSKLVLKETYISTLVKHEVVLDSSVFSVIKKSFGFIRNVTRTKPQTYLVC